MAAEIITKDSPHYDPKVNLQIMPKNRKWAGLAIMIAIATNASGNATLGTILPVITEELGGYSMYSWASAFGGMVAMVVAGIGGKLVARYGAKRILMIAIGALVVCRLFMFAAITMPIFVLLYVINGFGGGLSMACGMSSITNIFPAGKREVWVGIYGIVNGSIYFLFPFVGAAFATSVGWRGTYYCLLPFAIIALVLIAVFMPNVKEEEGVKFDTAGVLLLALAGAMIIVITSFGGRLFAWASIWTVLFAIVFVVSLIALAKVEGKKGDDALLAVVCFKHKGFIWIFIGAIFAQAQATPYTLYVGLFFQRVLGTSVQMSAWPAAITAGLCGVLNLAIAKPYGAYMGKKARKLIFWMCVFHMGTALFYFFAQPGWPVWLFLVVAVYRAFGSALHMTGFTWVCQTILPRNMMGFAVSICFMCNNIGGALSPAISNIILNAGNAEPAEQLPWIFFFTFICACIVGFCGLMIKEDLSFEAREGYSKEELKSKKVEAQG